MAKHECNVPGGTSGSWQCPVCGQRWYWRPNAGKGTDLWLGNDNVRLANGQKPKTTFWSWLCE
jgi:hypothetical protein